VIGRVVERGRIDALLAGARAGRSGALLLRGEAGIGKSALLTYAAHRARAGARPLTVLTMSGVESEAELAFAGLTELLRPVMDQVAALPEPQSEALHSALALRAEPASPLAVRAALLSLLAALAEPAPVLVTVDDVQWIDQSSVDALAFAIRRLAVERIAVVAAVRDDEPGALGIGPDARIEVGRLSDDEAHQLLDERAGPTGLTGTSGLTDHAADRLVQIAAGNPLALLELPDLPDVVGPAALARIEGVEPPPVGPRVSQAFRDRLDRLPVDTRLAVGLAAADASPDVGQTLAALAELGIEADALHPAERAGLLSVATNRIELRHPLLRSVAYHSLTAPDRRRIHQALAAMMHRPLDHERQTWHRAAAALGPDEAVASELDEVALAAEHRGALATTAHSFARAAQLSGDADRRARRLLRSADAWFAAGRWGAALDTLELAAAEAVDPGLRAEIAASTGQLDTYRFGPQHSGEILVAAADTIEQDDPATATRLLTYAVNVAVFAADVERAVRLADRAVVCGERAGGLHPLSGEIARIESRLMAGDPTIGDAIVPLARIADELTLSDLDDAEHVFSIVVLADYVLEQWDRAERLLDVMVRRARDTGRLFMLAVAFTMRGELEIRRGRWAAAYTTVTTELWEHPLDLPGVGAWLHAVQARVEAGLGLDDEAQSHGEAALAAATATRSHAVAAFADASLGFLELGRRRPQAAVDHLERVAATMDGGGFGEPGILWWAGDLIEAHWRLGNLGAARRRTEALQAQATATGRVWAQAVAARAAGLLASTQAETEAAFAAALDWHDRLDAPFERARTLLCLGERRREAGDPHAAVPLEEAQAVFDRLGAEPWGAQARRLLGTDARPTAPLPVSLTRQERQVAGLVGQGATNREAADQLFLSPRTIDFHLHNIYRKLNIRSRTELAIRLASTATATPSSTPSDG
jgi:DNA-binding CsgD family transcriptional regulator/tetratricopeptide (TPR) repeat protein